MMNSRNVTVVKIMNFMMAIGILLIPAIIAMYIIAVRRFGAFAIETQPIGGAMFLDGLGVICLSWIIPQDK